MLDVDDKVWFSLDIVEFGLDVRLNMSKNQTIFFVKKQKPCLVE